MLNLIQEWKEVSRGFQENVAVSKLPRCFGWKTYNFEFAENTGTLYFNYKGTFSMVLLALLDATHRFLYIGVGAYDRDSDGVSLAICL